MQNIVNGFTAEGSGFDVASFIANISPWAPVMVIIVGMSIAAILVRKMIKKAYSPAKRV